MTPKVNAYRVNWQDLHSTIVAATHVEMPRGGNNVIAFVRRGEADDLVMAANWDSVYNVERLTDDQLAELQAREDAEELLGELYVELSKRGVDAQVGTTEDPEPADDEQVPVA